MTRFIDAGGTEFGVEPMCQVSPIVPSTYYAAISRSPSARVLAEQNDEWAVYRKYMSRHSPARIYHLATTEIEGGITHAVAIPIH